MMETSYFQWLANETATSWWHDSGDAEELALALQHGAAGVTTNPILSYQARARPAFWRPRVGDLSGLTPPERAEALMHAVVTTRRSRWTAVPADPRRRGDTRVPK